ncbi:hypothetical protein D5086_012782 [Populus alba]|uniref:Uncharacterized protein n=1 Tax=Populus alba TaxID=43335 RepID=A0ACC4C3M4_POPAL
MTMATAMMTKCSHPEQPKASIGCPKEVVNSSISRGVREKAIVAGLKCPVVEEGTCTPPVVLKREFCLPEMYNLLKPLLRPIP